MHLLIKAQTHLMMMPNRQCAEAAKNANPIIRVTKASIIDITPALFHRFYGAFIRPRLDYALQAWRTWLKKRISLLEDVQRRFTKLVKCLKHDAYEEGSNH